MQFKTQLVILGARASKGEFQGNTYDYTEVFFQADTPEGANYWGQVGESMRWGLSSNIEKLNKHESPLLADVVMQQVSNGKAMTTIILDVVPVPKTSQQAKP
ncbi:hypothetical protein SAMN05421749_10248 [Acinetobacter marinus]|uniref:Uncharacterized protein n=1 Tax=Acinetobacter marinus TaxID=281375 RepID=A0A1G6HAZ7_9GAMM|nr:hypothetical protein [Acinetobacter marinus]SDB91477.1 hypothetical protein SAMN05421749_10248 [Acinetobacter marinus]